MIKALRSSDRAIYPNQGCQRGPPGEVERREALAGERDSGRLASLKAVSMGLTSILSPMGKQWGIPIEEVTKLYVNIERIFQPPLRGLAYRVVRMDILVALTECQPSSSKILFLPGDLTLRWSLSHTGGYQIDWTYLVPICGIINPVV